MLPDINIQGQFDILVSLLVSEEWREIWDSLNCSIETFAGLGLPFDASDLVVWQACQQHRLILVTGNRNARGPESLEKTVQTLNTPDSLPVFTLANPVRIARQRSYAQKVVSKMVEYLLDHDRYRGTGRLYLP
jgi:hypothetical protein